MTLRPANVRQGRQGLNAKATRGEKMKKHLTKKRIALLAVLAVGAISAVGAYAYFTSTGSGTGSATVGYESNWTVGQTGISGAANLYPDPTIGVAGNIQTKSYHVKNNGSGSQNLGDVKISVATSTGGTWTWCAGDAGNPAPSLTGGNCTSNGTPPCTKGDFSVGGSAVGAT